MRFKVQVFPIRDAFSVNQEDINQGEDRDSLNFLIIHSGGGHWGSIRDRETAHTKKTTQKDSTV